LIVASPGNAKSARAIFTPSSAFVDVVEEEASDDLRLLAGGRGGAEEEHVKCA